MVVKQKLRMLKNKVLRKIFAAKRQEITGECGKLHNPDLQYLNSSPNVIRDLKSRLLRWPGHSARKELSRNA